MFLHLNEKKKIQDNSPLSSVLRPKASTLEPLTRTNLFVFVENNRTDFSIDTDCWNRHRETFIDIRVNSLDYYIMTVYSLLLHKNSLDNETNDIELTTTQWRTEWYSIYLTGNKLFRLHLRVFIILAIWIKKQLCFAKGLQTPVHITAWRDESSATALNLT